MAARRRIPVRLGPTTRSWWILVAVAAAAIIPSAMSMQVKTVSDARLALQAIVDALVASDELDADVLLARVTEALEADLAADPSQTVLLLEGSLAVEGLATRRYGSHGGDGAAAQPEDVASSQAVYHVDLFNAVLGVTREVAARDMEGRTALMYAATENRFEVLRTLVMYSEGTAFSPLYQASDDQGRSYVDWCDHDGYSALMHASAANSVEAVNYLLNAGADPSQRCGAARFSALQLAENAGHEHVALALERHEAVRSAWSTFIEHPIVSGVIGALIAILAMLMRRTIVRYRQKVALRERLSEPGL